MLPSSTRLVQSETVKTPTARRSRSRVLVLLLLSLGVGLFTRLHGMNDVFVDGQTELVDPDSYYHAWRASEAARTFPNLPEATDPMVNHPEGHTIAWPPGTSYLVASLSKILSITNNAETFSRLGTIVVVCLGLLTVAMVFFLTLRLAASDGWAMLAACIYSLWPITIEYSRVGRFDHHVVEPLFTAMVLYFYLGAAWSTGRGQRVKNAVGCGLFLGASFWFWPSALFPVALLGTAIIVHQGLRIISRNTRGSGVPVSVVIFAIGCLIIVPLAVRSPISSRWAMQMPSLFHLTFAALLLASACSLWVLDLCWDRLWGDGRSSVRRGRVWGGLAVLTLPILLSALCLLIFPLEAGLRNLLRFGSRGDLWKMIFEQRALFSLPWPHQRLVFTYLGYAIPLAYLVHFLRPFGSPEAQAKQRLLLVISIPFFFVGLSQIRFLALPLVIITPLISTALASVAQKFPNRKVAVPLLCILVLLMMSPTINYLAEGLYLPNAKTKTRRALASWLKRNSEEGTAVLAPIALGHVLIHLGRVRTVGTPLIMPSTAAANRDTIRFYTTNDEAEARAIVARRKISHVVAAPLPYKRWQRYRRYLGLETSADSYRHRVAGRLFRRTTSNGPTAEAPKSPVAWLHHLRTFQTQKYRLELYQLR